MCGINGILGHIDNVSDRIHKMNDRVLHRGPDAEGIWLCPEAPVAFGHRRLSIIDLSENGAQPMVSASERYVITFNGEIYNYIEIAEELAKTDRSLRFRGTSDTELLLEAVERLGMTETLKRIKGMFAFAIYDRKEKCCYIARDRMGEKPLYYGMVGGAFVFASDPASIESLPQFVRKIDTKVLGVYFKGGYIPAPFSIYQGIYKLEPGHFLTVREPFDEWKDDIYWDIGKVAKDGTKKLFKGSFEEASESLEGLIKNSIKGQMISDVPLGAFLSGGIDSSLTVALMQSMSDKPVRTFTVGFEDEAYNEAVYAAKTAEHLGCEHTQMYVSKKDILDTIDEIPTAFSEPFADSSQIPTMLVSRMTKEHVTVSLSGDAGDEFFCGYNSYRDVRRGLEILSRKLPVLKGKTRETLGNVIYKTGGTNEFMHKLSVVLRVNTPEKWYRNIREDNLLLDELIRHSDTYDDKINTYDDGFLEGAESNLMLMDMLQYLPDDILVKVDRSGMMYSLESRIPLLDRDVMEFAWTLPQEYKYDGKTTKRILRDILYRYVPQEMMDRPKKGFSVPLKTWLTGDELGEWARTLIDDIPDLMGEYIDKKTVDKMWNKLITTGEGDREIWKILMLARWFEVRKVR